MQQVSKSKHGWHVQLDVPINNNNLFRHNTTFNLDGDDIYVLQLKICTNRHLNMSKIK